MLTGAPFRRQIYQRSTRLTIKRVIKPNMHLNVLHAEVFIYTVYYVLCVLLYGSASTITQHWLPVLKHACAATVSHDPGYLMLPYLYILFGVSVALGHMFTPSKTPGHLSPAASQLCFLSHLHLRVIENVSCVV